MEKPSIIITGASGFIGRYLLDSFKEDYIIYAIARRSRTESNIPYHHNIKWIQCDIANEEIMQEVGDYINEQGGIDYLIHLAAFYDFSYNDNPEYQRSNVTGTRNVLELGKKIGIKLLIFSSSLAACEFSNEDVAVTENSPLVAQYAYAQSKLKGENLCKEYSEYFSCYPVRFAAIFSDWCEYAPLYKFLDTWLSTKMESRILAGRGRSAIPYLHVNDLISLFSKIIVKYKELPKYQVFLASPSGSSSHSKLFEIATGYFYGKTIKPIFISKLLAYPGIAAKHLLKYLKLRCDEPFEKIWMVKFIDLKLNIDPSYTSNVLNWEPKQRYHIERRLLFLIEKMKNHKDEWAVKNEAALHKVARRTNMQIYEALAQNKEALLDMIIKKIKGPYKEGLFTKYWDMDENDFLCYMSTLYHLIMATIRSNDRNLMLKYIDDIAIRRFAQGFIPKELCATLEIYKDILIDNLSYQKEFKNLKQELYDNIGLTLQLAQDEVEDLYDNLLKKMSVDNIANSSLLEDCVDLQKMVRQLSAFYQIAPESYIRKNFK
ncbi:MAG: NAD(P)-dependent oxidoreductase [Candidatus Kapabacteria bacterium]|nr:NAD(P)-dependent oxidoreductase [Ignavibacteriota bacterium]MCW5884990.1 NAD(P)-dependent oxidoreductase [Candidatus Kapabacteria bacterium]